jgi:hypothetical protein
MIKPQRQLQRHDRHDVKGGVPEGLPEDRVAQQLLVVGISPAKPLKPVSPHSEKLMPSDITTARTIKIRNPKKLGSMKR